MSNSDSQNLGQAAARLASDFRLQRAFEHLHRCGSRPVAAFVAELLDENRISAQAIDRVLTWSGLDPATCQAVNADKFPRPRFYPVPQDLRRPPRKRVVAGGMP